jgi:GNAT superfamily N-acetyltransferase
MPVVEVLQSHHDKKSFDGGKPALNDFLQRYARQNADRNVGVTQLIVSTFGSTEILGYYTLVTRTVESALIPSRSLSPGPVGVVLLGRLATDRRSKGQGIGKLMLLRALSQTAEAARVIGIHALILDAFDDEALSWYKSLGWGFEALLDDPRRLSMPIATIRKLGL